MMVTRLSVSRLLEILNRHDLEGKKDVPVVLTLRTRVRDKRASEGYRLEQITFDLESVGVLEGSMIGEVTLPQVVRLGGTALGVRLKFVKDDAQARSARS